jgi:membrane protease YdiL (CAAX protease family)
MQLMESKPPLALRILRYPLTRLLLTLLVMGLLMWIAGKLFHLSGHRDATVRSAWILIPMELVLAVASLLAMLGVGLGVERSRFAGLGFDKKAVRELGVGFLGGAAGLTLSVGLLAIFGWYQFGGPPGKAGAHSATSEFVGAVLLFFLVGVFEEVFFRGIMFRLLEQWLGTWLALGLTSLQFGFAHFHNPGATWASTVGITLEAGVLLAAAFVVTRNLWAPIGLHWAWNLFEGPVFGTPVSGMDLPHLLHPVLSGPALWTGGAFGPEAGLICMFVGGAAGILLMGVAVRRGRTFTPAWLRRLLRMSRPPSAPVEPPPPLTA